MHNLVVVECRGMKELGPLASRLFAHRLLAVGLDRLVATRVGFSTAVRRRGRYSAMDSESRSRHHKCYRQHQEYAPHYLSPPFPLASTMTASNEAVKR